METIEQRFYRLMCTALAEIDNSDLHIPSFEEFSMFNEETATAMRIVELARLEEREACTECAERWGSLVVDEFTVLSAREFITEERNKEDK